MFVDSVNLMTNLDLLKLSNIMMLTFLFGYQHVYQFYPYNGIDSYKRGTYKDYQRFEICLNLLQQSLSPALIHLYAIKNYDEIEQKSAEKLIQDALESIKREIDDSTKLEQKMKNEIIEKIKSIKIIAGFPNELTDENMEKLYNEIGLYGNEMLIHTLIKMIKHNNKLDNEPTSRWTWKVNHLTRLNNLKYLADENILYVPTEYIKYPYFSPNRPRFMNTATLFTEVVLGFNEGLKKFFKNV